MPCYEKQQHDKSVERLEMNFCEVSLLVSGVSRMKNWGGPCGSKEKVEGPT